MSNEPTEGDVKLTATEKMRLARTDRYGLDALYHEVERIVAARVAAALTGPTP